MTVTVRVASPADLPAVRGLVAAQYAARGFCLAGDAPAAHEVWGDRPRTVVLLAEREGRPVGTLSLTPARVGHHAHVWRLATDPSCRGTPAVLAALLDALFVVLEAWGAATVVATAHPDYARPWRRLLGMTARGEVFREPTMNGAPAVLLVGDVRVMRTSWGRRGHVE